MCVIPHTMNARCFELQREIRNYKGGKLNELLQKQLIFAVHCNHNIISEIPSVYKTAHEAYTNDDELFTADDVETVLRTAPAPQTDTEIWYRDSLEQSLYRSKNAGHPGGQATVVPPPWLATVVPPPWLAATVVPPPWLAATVVPPPTYEPLPTYEPMRAYVPLPTFDRPVPVLAFPHPASPRTHARPAPPPAAARKQINAKTIIAYARNLEPIYGIVPCIIALIEIQKALKDGDPPPGSEKIMRNLQQELDEKLTFLGLQSWEDMFYAFDTAMSTNELPDISLQIDVLNTMLKVGKSPFDRFSDELRIQARTLAEIPGGGRVVRRYSRAKPKQSRRRSRSRSRTTRRRSRSRSTKSRRR